MTGIEKWAKLVVWVFKEKGIFDPKKQKTKNFEKFVQQIFLKFYVVIGIQKEMNVIVSLVFQDNFGCT